MSNGDRPVFNTDGKLIGVARDLTTKEWNELQHNGFHPKKKLTGRQARNVQEKAEKKKKRKKEATRRQRNLTLKNTTGRR